ncbi:hypothetical protein CROQUDRAFT_210520 [Cronartium quercuum f. sp. fusiforme G11]|uniref:Reverse transcriptase zinc-binding domain-containing protein n=1 Tax=Cronartium quercuum f. sp. fusiforme G11 TaxID=708437 RepID=A0A9P6NAY7_9BASI|nr:hypothetical protein CROQUDRAFT_210520 [Cronartium quercuum f. sp. fusiforme G11]
MICQLRSGHCARRSWLHQIKAEPDPRCESCNIKETPTHYLAYCKQYPEQRKQIKQALKKEKIKINTYLAAALLDDARVFPHLVKYIEADRQICPS